ncbi:MAG: PQQ-dependent sugar dehydrogenase [Cyclobacteriaceae bacterium]
MKKSLSLVFAVFLLFPLVGVFAQQGETIYKTYCAGCHGSQMQGNTASKLIKTDWLYGRGKGAIVRNIRFGIATTEMIAWGTVLKKEEINAVADYIVASQVVPPNAIRTIPKKLTTRDYSLKVEELIATGLNTPWGIEFVDARRALITERSGSIRWMVDGKLDARRVLGLPKTYSQNTTGGYMDIVIDPDYTKNAWVYLAYSQTDGDPADKNARGMTKVVRGQIIDDRWTNEQTLFEVQDSLKIPGGNRWGCRFLFDEKGYLYFTIGDMARAMDSQNPGKPTGKIFRVHPDGSIPKDNPFVGEKGALAAIFTIGNRNVQGLARHPVTGEIWATEHGPMGGDELNIIKKGSNYGWPLVTYGVDYTGEIVSNENEKPGMEPPVLEWTPSIAVCPAEFVSGNRFSKWKNNLLVGALAFEEIRRVVIENNKVTEQEMILKGVGRVRDLKLGPDGALYVLLNNPDMVLRISPEKEP